MVGEVKLPRLGYNTVYTERQDYGDNAYADGDDGDNDATRANDTDAYDYGKQNGLG